ncbi:hypothetical protein [Microvirga soli]|uniref:hypothetical protein n=1 Tax=Microvirga soli TaxID=1854496 RepID=UPI00191EB2C1|nr:hypothetical protein [Microvirga soli]
MTKQFSKLDAIHYANTLSIQRLVRQYLSLHPADFAELHPANVWEIGGITITAVRIGCRTGVPHTCTTWRYLISGDNWSMAVRAVWQADGTLLQPTATHCQIESYHPDTPETRRSVNAWLHGVAW